MADQPPDDSPEARAYRRGFRDKGDKREDYAVDLFRTALGSLADFETVDRILIELSRLYNPLVDGPIVDPTTRGAVLGALSAGDTGRARVLLEQRLDLYYPSELRPPARD
jgi:hypothetical protein